MWLPITEEKGWVVLSGKRHGEPDIVRFRKGEEYGRTHTGSIDNVSYLSSCCITCVLDIGTTNDGKEISMKTTAIYLRVSSTNGQKFDSQWEDLKQWMETNKPDKVKVYRDKFTGKTMDRPSMQKLMDDLHKGEVGTILCWRLDRLGRTAAGLTKLFDDLRKHKCNLISLKDNLDLSTPAGRLNANIIASVAAYETEVRAERVKAGQQAAREKGKRWGGSKPGIRKGKVASVRKHILTLHHNGVPKTQIAKSLGISIPSVYDVIRKGA
jgi:DNA invertase Pin-like site-specific DNA recombinase